MHARARAFLESVAKRQFLITYQDLANALQILPPHSIHRVTEALERLMEEDAAADRPFLAALAISKARGGLPGPGATTNNEDIMLTENNPTPNGGRGLSRSPPITTV